MPSAETAALISRSLLMPRFYLNLRSGDDYIPDQEGSEVADLAAARMEAINAVRDLVAADIRLGKRLNLSDAVEIDDQEGRLVLIMLFREAVSIKA
jgi:hypothetical protein|tara:strand:- start:5336 stop:5623 length:288 start_codon:yes stop_codon:yes gene_type:complete